MVTRPGPPMIPLGYGKFVRADRIVLLEPLSGDEGRGDGARTRVWIEGVPDPVIASRSERAIVEDVQRGPRRARRRPDPDDPPSLF